MYIANTFKHALTAKDRSFVNERESEIREVKRK